MRDVLRMLNRNSSLGLKFIIYRGWNFVILMD